MHFNIFSNNKYLIGDIEWGGFGAMYARRKLIIQLAHAFNRVPIFRFTSYIYDDPFSPFDVNISTIKDMGINEIKKFDFTDNEDKVVFFDFGSYWGSDNMNKFQCWHPEGEEYLFYSGYLYNMLKLNEEYRSKVDENIYFIKEKYNIEDFKNITALHLRRGDKIVESPYLSDAFIFEFLEKIKSPKKIFVTSDEIDYIHEIEKKYKDYEFIYDSEENRYGNKGLSNVNLIMQNPSLAKEETLTFVKNIEIFKQCKCVIGSHSAQMTKIGGSINSYLRNENNLYLINSNNNQLEVMGNSEQTS
jgi:hypothetical protein